MKMGKIKKIAGKGIPLRGDDIDTDRIIPARFLKEITFENMGKYAFYDERFDAEGNKKNHPFNEERFSQGTILIVNKNFGCGSSREHAPQALMRFGIKAIMGESFADIFAGNCTMLGIPVITAGNEKINYLMDAAERNPEQEIIIDIEKKTVSCNNKKIDIEMKDSARSAILNNTWDSASLMLENKGEIFNTAKKIPYLNKFEVGN